MSKRSSFTEALALLLIQMGTNKDLAILDFVKRSDAEQARLFNAKLGKCDGKNKISKHQIGQAADIYLITPDGKFLDWNAISTKAQYYHDFWETLGGAAMLDWDKGHFEWR